LKASRLTHFTIGILSLNLSFTSPATARTPAVIVAPPGGFAALLARPTFQEDGRFESLESALRSPERVRRLVLGGEDPEVRRLPPGIGKLVNLESMELACLEKLEALPEEIGSLRKLRELVIDNGNGCAMNVTLPRSVGRLDGLRVLRLYGALDGREVGSDDAARAARSKELPDTLARLQKLEELDLGRNGIRSVPALVAGLRGLKRLKLDYNAVREVPAFVGDLPRLEELSLNANGGVRLPASLARRKGLKVYMGNNRLTLREQRALRSRFPAAQFFFENEYDDDAANEEAPAPRPGGRRGGRRR
jgi:hypothetical protein